MDPVKNGTFYAQTRGYRAIVKIGDTDYSSDLNKVEIINSILSPWQTFILTFSLDQRDIISEKLYGNQKINLRLQVFSQDAPNQNIEDLDFDLIHLDDISYAPMRQVISEEKPQPTPLQLIAIPRNAFKTMTTTVNEIYSGITVKDAISQLVSTNTEATLKYDNINNNPQRYDTIFIPPMTLYRAIKMLDDTYGIYNGVCNLGFCNYDNSVYICNLTKKPESSNWITLTHLAFTSQNEQIAKFGESNNFYTQNPLVSKYGGNKIISNIGFQIYSTAKPMDRLFLESTMTVLSICEEYGITPQRKTDIFYDPILKSREVYYIAAGSTGDGSIKPILGRSIIDMSTISTILDRQLLVGPFLQVGQGVKLICNASDYSDLSGKYILKSSHIVFTKGYKVQQEWGAGIRINLCRTNKTSS